MSMPPESPFEPDPIPNLDDVDPEDLDLRGAAGAVTAALKDLKTVTGELRDTQDEDRHRFWIAVLCFLILFFGAGWQIRHNTDLSRENRQFTEQAAKDNEAALRNNCNSRNEGALRSRAFQEKFIHILVPDLNALTPEQRTRVQSQIDQVHAAEDETYIIRDCTVPLDQLNR